MRGYRMMIVGLLMFTATAVLGGESITLQKVHGDVTVRAGVAESWNRAETGDILNPDATLKTGKKSTAVLFVASSGKRITLPAEVMVDISDIRELTQEELMLKLTMEKVRASSYEWKNKEMKLPTTTTVHGEAKDAQQPAEELNLETGKLQMNGARMLYDNSFYSTSALRALDVLRRYPPLGDRFENRLLVAEALEKAELKGEALNEYVALSQLSSLTAPQRNLVKARISQLRK